MNKLMETKCSDMTVKQTLQYLAIVFAIIYLPIMAIFWIIDNIDQWEWPEKLRLSVEEKKEELPWHAKN